MGQAQSQVRVTAARKKLEQDTFNPDEPKMIEQSDN
jgi:hypothetical protein